MEIKKDWLSKQRASESQFPKLSGASLGGPMSPGRMPQVPFFGHIRKKENRVSLTQVTGTRAEQKAAASEDLGV